MTAMTLFKNACRIHLGFIIARYLMSNADGRWDGFEKAKRHQELCVFYVAAVRGVELDIVRRDYEEDFQAVHDQTQALTDHLDEVIGFPVTGDPDYAVLEPLFFEHFHTLALAALADALPTAA